MMLTGQEAGWTTWLV